MGKDHAKKILEEEEGPFIREKVGGGKGKSSQRILMIPREKRR